MCRGISHIESKTAMPVSRVINPPAPNAAGDKTAYKLTRVRFNNTTTFVYKKIEERKDTTTKIVKPPPPPVKEIPAPKKFDPSPPPLPSPSPSPPPSPEPEEEYESEPEVTETESDIQSETTSEFSEPPTTNNHENFTPLPVNHMEEIVLEKLKLVNADPDENRDKLRELWDDIQILAFLEEETELSKAPKAIAALQEHIGEQKSSKLTNIISRIAKKEIQPKTKAVKIPPSWIDQGKNNKEFGDLASNISGAKLHIFF